MPSRRLFGIKEENMSFKKIGDIPVNGKESTVVSVLRMREATTAAKSTYVVMTISDGDQVVDAKMWNRTLDNMTCQEGELVWAELARSIYNDADSWEVRKISSAPAGLRFEEFVKSAPYPGDVMYRNLLAILTKQGDTPCVRMAMDLLEANKEKFLKWPAAKSIHHNYYGGLLYHTLRVVVSTEAICKTYRLDAQLAVPAAAIHDIGKVRELESDVTGSGDYGEDGVAFGHLQLGLEMIAEMAALHPDRYTMEDLKWLRHIIASHHGKPEWGAIASPCIPEAWAVHYADALDANMTIMEEGLKEILPGHYGYKPGLGGRIYRRP